MTPDDYDTRQPDWAPTPSLAERAGLAILLAMLASGAVLAVMSAMAPAYLLQVAKALSSSL